MTGTGAARRRTAAWRLAAAAAALAVAGCASAPPAGGTRPAPAAASSGELNLSGRLSVRVEPEANADAQTPKAFSGSFDFAGRAEAGSLTLTSPLGTIVALATWSPQGAELRTGGDRQRFADTTEMAGRTLGWGLSLPALISWISGRPDPSQPSQALPPPGLGFEQSGWTVDLADYAQGIVRVHRDYPRQVRVQVRLDTGTP